MPGAGDHVIDHFPARKGSTLVGAKVVDGVVLSVHKEHGDYALTDHERPAFALGNLADPRNRYEVRHGKALENRKAFAKITHSAAESYPIGAAAAGNSVAG
jgi:hypothetical protein